MVAFLFLNDKLTVLFRILFHTACQNNVPILNLSCIFGYDLLHAAADKEFENELEISQLDPGVGFHGRLGRFYRRPCFR